jgi:hypothetical protein
MADQFPISIYHMHFSFFILLIAAMKNDKWKLEMENPQISFRRSRRYGRNRRRACSR